MLGLASGPAQAQLADARRAELAGDLPRAEKAYEIEIAAKPSAELWQRLGLVRHLQNKFDAAIPAFQNAVRSNPALWTSHLFLGMCLYRTNQFSESARSLETADRLAPKTERGRDDVDYWLGATRIALGTPLAGLQPLERLLARNPRHVEALELAAKAYADIGSALWNEVAEEHFDSAPGLEVHGHALESEGRTEAALDAFQRSKKIAPARPGPGLAIGKLLLRQGNAGAALEALKAELALAPRHPEVCYFAGLAATQLGQNTDAADLLEVATGWRTTLPEAPLALAQVYLALRQRENAVRAANQAVEASPASAAAHDILIAALSQTGRSDLIQQENRRWQKLQSK